MVTSASLAALVNGDCAGSPNVEITDLRPIDDTHEAAISPFFRKQLLSRNARLPGAVLTTRELEPIAVEAGIPGVIRCDHPLLGLAALIDHFFPETAPQPGVHPTAVIDPQARVAPTATVEPLAVIEADVDIGHRTRIGPHAVILRGSRIGRYVSIGPGAVIGSDGFGFAPSPKGPVKIRQVGRVIIEDCVEIGANTCVDRATLGATIIGQAAKLDNLVQIGHNTRVGAGAILAGQVGLAGSVAIGDGAMLGGQVGVADHIHIGADAKIAAKSGVTRDIAADQIFAGYPAMPHAKWLRAMAWLTRSSARNA
ncbi:MAG: UDP-3-O-(3-hydroxymyristoyl)glucosamine N-acyltransferase [Myxococcota bacterium]|nr:UDP-3-O-(3-hydroxymyristoyl)glucosamine N-acyltransferase [Myxococcota bacterium]